MLSFFTRRILVIASIAFTASVLLTARSHPNGYEWDGWDQGQRGKMLSQWGGRLAPSWLKPGEDRTEEVIKLKVLKNLLEERYQTDKWRDARPVNSEVLDRLAYCIGTNSCGPGEETVILLASFHFSQGRKGWASGEDIWAGSTIEAFQTLNITLLYTYGPMDTLMIYQAMPDRVAMIFWEGSEFDKCRDRDETNYLQTETEHTPGQWQTGKKGCIKKEGFDEGIPVWKNFMFHFWGNPVSPLGYNWTVSPEDYARGGTGNNYLGYSIETYCRKMKYYPAKEREHRGMVFGKQFYYFDPNYNEYYWGDMIAPSIAAMPPGRDPKTGEQVPFEIIAMVNNKGDEIFQHNFTNLGSMQRDEWTDNLARSKFLLGIGKPEVSPSPYDALCLGVPFINPLKRWNREDPDDRSQWNSQHNGLLMVPEPYVYHVQRGNQEQLQAAMRKAIDTPVDRYIPEKTTLKAVLERHRKLLTTDWKAVAEEYVQKYYTVEGKEFPFLL